MKNRQKRIFFLVITCLSLLLIMEKDNIYFIHQNSKEIIDDDNISILTLSAENPVAFEWEVKWGTGSFDFGTGLYRDSSDNIYITGYGTSNNDMVVVKYNSSGDKIWDETWGGANGDNAYDVVADSAGNVYVSGVTYSYGAGSADMCLVKFNNLGSFQWYETFGTGDLETASGVALDPSEYIYTCGGDYDGVSGNITILKYEGNGNLIWSIDWGGVAEDYAYGILLDPSNNIFITGYTENFGADGRDIILVKFNSTGDYQWNQTWGKATDDYGRGIDFDSDGNIYVSGCYGTTMCLSKFNSSGIIQWNYTYGGNAYPLENSHVVVDSSDNIYLSGSKMNGGTGQRDFYIVKCNNSGIELWNRMWGHPSDGLMQGPIVLDSLENVYMAGTISYGGVDYDLIITKFDNVPPEINITTPYPYQLFGNDTIDFNLAIKEPNINTTWYSLNGGPNYTFTGTSGKINQTAWDECGNGTVNIKFYINDSVGYMAHDEVIVRKNITLPVIKIISPMQFELFGNATMDFNLTIIGKDIDHQWYSLDAGPTRYFFMGTNGTIDQAAWNARGNGTVLIKFSVNNTNNDVISKEVEVRKDTHFPSFTADHPDPSDLYGPESPHYWVTITDPDLEYKWYSFDNGITKHFYSEDWDYFNQEAWNACGNGTVNIRFYANNTAGNTAFMEIPVYKDCLGPFIEINLPTEDASFENAPSFDLSITDAQFDESWYCVWSCNQWSKNYSFTGSTGSINQTLWNSICDGGLIIRFYANDTFGNLNYVDITVKKFVVSEEVAHHDDGIPGYDFFLILCVISLTIIILIRKKH